MRKKLLALPFGLGLVLALAVPSFAATSIDYTNTFASVQTEVFGAIPQLMVGILAIFAVLTAVRLGLALYRRVAKA
jgi:hypothetical protein